MSDIQTLTIGATLKNRREELGLTLAGIAEKTCIRSTFLKAMEEDRFDGFPGDAYLHGFLKLFAETLGLDAVLVINQFREQTGIPLGGREARTSILYDLPPMAHRNKRKILPTVFRVMLLGGLILGVTWGVFYLWPFSMDLNWFKGPPHSSVVVESSAATDSTVSRDPIVIVPVEVKAQGFATEPGVNAAKEERQGVDYMLPAGGGMLRVKALEAVNVETLIDNLPLKQYFLAKDTVLSWRIVNSLRLQVDVPGRLTVWLENEPLDLQGQSQLSLRANLPAAEEERH